MDETMTTSSSSTPSNLQDASLAEDGFEEEDNLFPEDSPNAPRTPANDHLNAAAPGELSPPRSQPAAEEYITSLVPETNSSGPMANGTAETRSSSRHANLDPLSGSETKNINQAQDAMVEEQGGANQPGWGWKNKKAQEESQRAWENTVDRDFSLKEYGDVMMLGKAQMEAQGS
jgi:hypothetical protein